MRLCWVFSVILSAPMVYDEVDGAWMCVYVCMMMWESLWASDKPLDQSHSVLDRACWLDQISEHSDLLLDWNSSARLRLFRSTSRARVQNALCFSGAISFAGIF